MAGGFKYACGEERRRDAVRARRDLNGIDFVEVEATQTVLVVHFIHGAEDLALRKENVRLSGGERIRDLRVIRAVMNRLDSGPDEHEHVLKVTVSAPGDFSTYRLELVQPDPPARPNPALEHFDPLMRAVDFSFKVNCAGAFDCTMAPACAPPAAQEPALDYLARDFNSLRQALLDRLALVLPEWQERHPADLGVALVELLAYVGDYLSYRQDAVATEAYMGTARKRVSVRRHARLVDYLMHDGCNARTYVQVLLDPAMAAGTQLSLAAGRFGTRAPAPGDAPITRFLSQCNAPAVIHPDDLGGLWRRENPVVFEALEDVTLFPEHAALPFHTWGEHECCLPAGATSATLLGHYPDLRPGMVLVLGEVCGARSGAPADADLRHRHPVRLVEVALGGDPLVELTALPPGVELTGDPPQVPVTEIRWHAADRLPFALCVSAEADDEHGGRFVRQVSLAWGNMVPADHGMTCLESEQFVVPAGRFRPALRGVPVTRAAPYDPAHAPESAGATLRQALRDALPAVLLQEDNGAVWRPRRDLLGSGRFDRAFVVEMEEDGRALLRFGDGRHGQAPEEATRLAAWYRSGTGKAGNLGAEALAHIVSTQAGVAGCVNRLPAVGGVEPETIEEVRQKAPYAFRVNERAVTAQDYAERAQTFPGVQQAAATLRWTGSWHTVFVSVDRLGGAGVDADFERGLREHLEHYRLAGHDLEVDDAHLVPLELEFRVRVKADFFRKDVEQHLLEVFSSRRLPDGGLGLFHPDRLTLGQRIYLSPLIAAAQAVEGVEWVEVVRFGRQGRADAGTLRLGYLQLGRLEIGVLENSPNDPDRGSVRFDRYMEGGK